MILLNKYTFVVLMGLIVFQAHAEKEAADGRFDPRIKHHQYHLGQVYAIHTHYLQTTLVMFAENEKIIHVEAGDPLAWQLVPVNNLSLIHI